MARNTCWMLFCLMFFLAGCRPAVTVPSTVSPVPTEHEPAVTAAPQASQTADENRPCGWNWASQELPEVSAQLNQALRGAGLADVEGRAAAYGENCLAEDGSVVRFAAMQTDIYLVIPGQDMEDAAAMGDWVARVLPVLEPFSPGQVPGPNLGYVGIRFTGPAGEQNLWFSRKTGQGLLDIGLHGKNLFDALRSKP